MVCYGVSTVRLVLPLLINRRESGRGVADLILMWIVEAASSSTAIHTYVANLPYRAINLTHTLQTRQWHTQGSMLQPGGSHIIDGMGLHCL
jgi:hypothetical protein